jgi:hypothetical protein
MRDREALELIKAFIEASNISLFFFLFGKAAQKFKNQRHMNIKSRFLLAFKNYHLVTLSLKTWMPVLTHLKKSLAQRIYVSGRFIIVNFFPCVVKKTFKGTVA